MKIKRILLVALIALGLGLASVEVAAPVIASGNAGAGGGDVHAGQAAPAIAGSNGIRLGQETNPG